MAGVEDVDAGMAPFATGGVWSWSTNVYDNARKKTQIKRRKRATVSKAPTTLFREYYDMGNLPILLDQVQYTWLPGCPAKAPLLTIVAMS